MRVLIVEDNADVQELVSQAMAKDGYSVATAYSAVGARGLLERESFDLLILDLGLPDGDGMEICRRLRATRVSLPILILTAHATVPARVSGLDGGADDFLGKPFAVAELRARVRALLRRGQLVRPGLVEVAGARLDFEAKRAWFGQEEVPLTAREWALMALLVARRGSVVPRLEILESIWGTDSPAAGASLEVIIGRVRKKLGSHVVRTLRGEGYAIT
ncbi:MAG: response regulator transcription factor [Polyangiaceae bacterium]